MAAKRSRAKNPERRMSLGEHLVELRKRLFRAALGIVAGAIGGWLLYPWIWDALQKPVVDVAAARGADQEQLAAVALNYTSITGAFDIHLQISITAGLVLSSPIWLYQVFAFLVPGLKGREKRYLFGFFFSAVPLFLIGCVTGWLMLPHIVSFMAGFVPEGSTSFYDTKYYLDFVLKLVLATGIAFVLPVFLVLLNFVGVLQARSILKGWRWAVLVITVFAAMATPAADAVSMVLLAIPMVALYFAAVGVSFWHDRAVARRQDGFDASIAAEA